MEQNKFKLPENTTGFTHIEVTEGKIPGITFHHKDGYRLYVLTDEVILVDAGGNNRVGTIKIS